MLKKIILVGCTTQKNKLVNGQSMMFQLLVDKLQERKVHTVVVDFGKSLDVDYASKRVSGQFSYTKLADNFILSLRYLYVLLVNRRAPVYINTSQSKVGFIRDYIFIHLAKLLGHKVVAHQFGSNYGEFYNSQSKSFRKKISHTLAAVDRIIVEGDYTKKQFDFLSDYQDRVLSVPNGLPQEVKSNLVHLKKITTQEPVKIIYLSNLIESKGYWDVLKAVDILVNKDKRDVQSVFAGKFLEGVDDKSYPSAEKAREAFFTFIENNHLQNNVIHYEGLYNDEKAKAFSDAHFFVLPSYYINEGQPVSVLEALAYGCVPVVTRYRLIPDMVNEENGVFVSPQSPSEIADAIKALIDNPGEYNKRSGNGIQYYLNNFTADRYIERILKLLPGQFKE